MAIGSNQWHRTLGGAAASCDAECATIRLLCDAHGDAEHQDHCGDSLHVWFGVLVADGKGSSQGQFHLVSSTVTSYIVEWATSQHEFAHQRNQVSARLLCLV